MTATQYILPPEYQVFERDERFLMIDPRNFIWFVTDEAGKTAFDGLARNGSPWEAAEELAKALGTSFSASVIADYVDEFINHLLEIKFLHEGHYIEEKWAPSLMERPKLLYLHLTSKCNLRCPYCYNQEHRFQLIQLNRKKEEPSFEGSAEDFFRVIDDAARLGFNQVKLTGGEALLNKDALAIAARAKAHGMFVNLLTNATTITEESVQQIAQAVSVVSISLGNADSLIDTRSNLLRAIRFIFPGESQPHYEIIYQSYTEQNGIQVPQTIDIHREHMHYRRYRVKKARLCERIDDAVFVPDLKPAGQ